MNVPATLIVIDSIAITVNLPCVVNEHCWDHDD